MKTWFITGTSSGLELEVAKQLLAKGHRVAATARAGGGAWEVLGKEHRDHPWTADRDVGEPGAVRAVADKAFGELGRIDVVFSNAGFGTLGAVEELSEDHIARQLAVNLAWPIHLTRAVAPWLSRQGGGRIIQMSSPGGTVPGPRMSGYNASKSGGKGFCEAAAIELAAFGIEVTLVAPGGTRTAFTTSLTRAEPLPAYEAGVVSRIRSALDGGTDAETLRHAIAGDPVKIAHEIITSAATAPAPRKLVFGAAAHDSITAALRGRLADLEAQRDLALSTDADDVRAQSPRSPGPRR
ncbi:SDR family NAD(P)-dependent oxidoreductase [Amycolatopsis sp. FDAARGOS 1241]|uniref:SDR family NAD(P)-dependent oxidoreductase n=1 Tax=Amycolatopsis sp. FDAARGOS 1241 TaxID=2778070 RepID=UPI00194DEA3F|nr:SDR family NAD(P)-dependent oxidoreductase [Amycolatopsis sp. FDAARGOS 1241]QRP43438.1 SDR family NAD(P)-dependent oxidoreductase [Amycolatopsis sp. FDAARGOS 1241]